MKFLGLASKITIAATILFFVGTLSAMILYPGGTSQDPSTIGYRFFANFFSDLGRTVSFNGTPQTASSILFNGSLIIMGIAIIPLFATLPSLYLSNGIARKLFQFGGYAGIVAGLCYAGVGFTPWNLFFPQHMLFVKSAFILILVSMFLCAVALWLDNPLPLRYAIILSLFSAAAAGYVWLLFFGPGFDTPRGFAIQVAGQKIIVYLELATLGVFANGILKSAKILS